MKVNLFGIGSAKCGTTTLFDTLDRHPQVCGSRPKEANFFAHSKNFAKGYQWYHNACFSHYSGQKYALDVTPNYSGIDFQVAAKRLYDYNPKAKLIYIIRDPVEKLRSGWAMCYRNYVSKTSSDNPAVKWAQFGFSAWVGQQWASGHIKSLYYGSIINHYLKYFRRESIYICTLERLSICYQEEFLKLLDFLELSLSDIDLSLEIKSNSKRLKIGRLAGLAFLLDRSPFKSLPKAAQIAYNARYKWFLRDLSEPSSYLEPHLESELLKLLQQDYDRCQICLDPHVTLFKSIASKTNKGLSDLTMQ